ncbi:limonene hydroxylase [Cohnella terricola]|uniref:Limonene hydroxylase n=1 Tax=Cohnella terricola TaxID=1289167 RepID=A0A559JGV9_9BACL|nr:limonene hydroxylase [Cohnella terricola]TVX99098.1 limonene hydroxylase [Cohnella terricola]
MFSFFNKEVLYPWKEGASIYETIRSKIDEHGRLQDDKLPDDESYWEGQPFRWVAGGLDGAFGHHAGGGKDEANVKETIHLLTQLSRKPNHKTRRSAYLKLMKADVLSVIDPLLEEVRNHPGLNAQSLYNEALWLAEKGAHRNVIKFGIALLGQFDTEHHRELILTLGRHDEFTLYAAVAIQNSLNAPNAALFELAQAVDGWGKIQLVERLDPETQEMKDWLLRKGCQNSVMNEYLAYTCAQKGELHAALTADEVDEALYNGAGDILSALTHGGPEEDMDDYEHAPVVIGDYLRLSRAMCQDVSQLTGILDLLDWLNHEAEQWEERLSKGWTEEMRSQYREIADSILATDGWEEKVWTALRSRDARQQHFSIRVAKALRLEIWEELFEQLRLSPLNGSLIFELMNAVDEQRVQTLVSFAEESLPLTDIASGPADEMGLGLNYEAHSALDLLVQELDRYPGVGRKLIATALQSPVVRNRNMALKALEAWPLAEWEESLVSAVKRLAEIEPVPDVKERISEVMEGKKI